jgi:hypothetical protein
MADKPEPREEARRPAPTHNESEAQRVNRALAEAAEEAEARQADETVPGGRYIVDGVLVDAEGKPLKSKD